MFVNTLDTLLIEVPDNNIQLLPQLIHSRFKGVGRGGYLPTILNYRKVLLTLHDTTGVYQGIVTHMQACELTDGQVDNPIMELGATNHDEASFFTVNCVVDGYFFPTPIKAVREVCYDVISAT